MKVRLPYQSSHSTKKGGKSRTPGERMKSIDSMEGISNARRSNTPEQESEHPNVPSIQMFHSSSKGIENTIHLSITPLITTETNAFMEVKRGTKNRKHSRKNKQHHNFGSRTASSNASVSNKSKPDFEVVQDSHAVNKDDIHNSRLNTLDVNRLDVPFLNKESNETVTTEVPFLNDHSENYIDCDGAVLAVGSSIRERKANESFETEYPSLFDIHSNDDGDAKTSFHNDANSCICYHYYTNDNDPQGLLPTPQAEQEGGYPIPAEHLAMTQQPYWYMEHPFMINNEYPLPYHGVYFAPHYHISTTSTSTTTTTAIEPPAQSIVGYEQVNIGGCIYFHPVFE
jgi:hypothetical protein